MQWDYSTDFVVVGSGAGGMTAALTASILGGDSLVLEKTDQYGGTTALSGGVVWVPNNHSMLAAGLSDCEVDAMVYLRQVVGPDVAEERLHSYVTEAPKMLRFMAEHTPVKFDAALRYADYYPELEGGKSGGRSMEPIPTRRRVLGKEAGNQRAPEFLSGFMRFSMTVKESREMMDMTFKGKLYMLRNMAGYYLDLRARLKGLPDSRMTLGQGLVANCRRAMLDRDIPLWRNAETKELIVEDGRVVGAIVEREGRALRVEARKGVLLAAGGMGANVAMRQQYGQLPTGESFSSESPGNVGDGIRMGREVGAALDFMGSAWWTPSVKLPSGEIQVLIAGKSYPGSMFVDADGRRFCNEAAPYEDVIKALWQNHRNGRNSVPCYMVFDARFRREYMAGPLMPGKVQPDERLPADYKSSGFLKKANTVAGLAEQIGVDPAVLKATIERQNGFANSGKDLDFGRGDSENDRYYSDPSIGPNPNLAPIVKAPFYAFAVYPGDLGTKGGLKCDGRGRVLRECAQPIAGLYAAGNCSAAVMGDSYPGAGSTIGPAMTFGYLAAREAMSEAI